MLFIFIQIFSRGKSFPFPTSFHFLIRSPQRTLLKTPRGVTRFGNSRPLCFQPPSPRRCFSLWKIWRIMTKNYLPFLLLGSIAPRSFSLSRFHKIAPISYYSPATLSVPYTRVYTAFCVCKKGTGVSQIYSLLRYLANHRSHVCQIASEKMSWYNLIQKNDTRWIA